MAIIFSRSHCTCNGGVKRMRTKVQTQMKVELYKYEMLTVKRSCFLGQFCDLAKMHLVSVHAAFRVSTWPKYATSGVRLSRAV